MVTSTRVAPFVRARRSVSGWIGLVLALVVGAVIAVAVGLASVLLAVVVLLVRMLAALAVVGGAWLWYLGRRRVQHPYPFDLIAPRTAEARSTALDGAFLRLLPRTVGMAARLCAPLLAPLALFASLVGVVAPRWRSRPYLAVFTLPALMRKTIGIGKHTGLLNDGDEPIVEDYEAFLGGAFPQLRQFAEWWWAESAGAEAPFQPSTIAPDAPVLGRLTLGPPPDPLGAPGLAVTVMRRARMLGLRDLMLSQGEIDELGDPDLDGRHEVAVIRVVSRRAGDGRRHWIVQLPSTRSWHPRSGQAPNDITADVTTLAMRETTLTRAALEAMKLAGVAADEPVLVAGFSLGGAIASQLTRRGAQTGFTITHAFTAGAANSRYRLAHGIRMLSIEHLLDTVPPVDGRRNPASRPQHGGWTTVTAGPALAAGLRPAELHFSPDYTATAGMLDDEGERIPAVAEFLQTAREFFGDGQEVRDFAARRAHFGGPQSIVPISINSTARRGITPGDLRRQLRRVSGVIAVDVYRSHSGLPTTVLWNADVLVDSLRPWLEQADRAVVYRALLSLLTRRRAVGLHLRLRARRTPGILLEARMVRQVDGQWRESVDIAVDSDEAAEAYLPLLVPEGWASRVTVYPADAFD